MYTATWYLSSCVGLSLSLLGSGDGGVDLLAILPSDARGRGTVATTLTRSDTDDMGVNGAGNAVRDFDVQLGDSVLRVDTGLADISNSGALDHVPHCEPLDRLVLGDAARAVGASDEPDVATSLFVASAGSSFLGLRFK